MLDKALTKITYWFLEVLIIVSKPIMRLWRFFK